MRGAPSQLPEDGRSFWTRVCMFPVTDYLGEQSLAGKGI